MKIDKVQYERWADKFRSETLSKMDEDYVRSCAVRLIDELSFLSEDKTPVVSELARREAIELIVRVEQATSNPVSGATLLLDGGIKLEWRNSGNYLVVNIPPSPKKKYSCSYKYSFTKADVLLDAIEVELYVYRIM